MYLSLPVTMDDEVRFVKLRMDSLNRELLWMEKESILLSSSDEDKEKRTHMEDKFRDWKLRKERFKTEELHPLILRQLPLCHDALDVLKNLDSTRLDERFQDLRIDQPRTVTGIGGTEEEEDEVPELEESEVKKKVLERMVDIAKSLVTEIKDDVEGTTERQTVSFWLKNQDNYLYSNYEWIKLNDLRFKVRQTAIELSYLLAQFVVFLMMNDQDSRLQQLIRKMKSLSLDQEGRREVAEKFFSVIGATKENVSRMKLKEMKRAGSNRWEEMMEKMVGEFFEIALHLDAVMSTLSIPVEKSMVAGARVRLEDMLGHALCAMQGLKMEVDLIRGKRKSDSWKALKVKVAELWNDLECFMEEENAVVPGAHNDDDDAGDGVVPAV